MRSLAGARAFAWLAGLLLAGCATGTGDTPSADGEYASPRISGVTVVYRNGAKTDSLAAPDSLLAFYRFQVDADLWGHMAFRVRGDGFSADFRAPVPGTDILRDTTVSGRLGRPDSAFINLNPARKCDSAVDGRRLTNLCFERRGDALSIPACLDVDYPDSAFAFADFPAGATIQWRHLRGLTCAQRPDTAANRTRTDIRIEFPKQ